MLEIILQVLNLHAYSLPQKMRPIPIQAIKIVESGLHLSFIVQKVFLYRE